MNNYAIRTCLISRSNEIKEKMLRFVLINDSYVFDEKHKIQKRGVYILNNVEIFEKFSKKYKIDVNSLDNIFNILKNNNSTEEKLVNILINLKQSEFLVYGIDDNIENIKKNKVSLLIIPSDINGKTINRFRKLSKIYKTKIIFLSKQKKLKEIFERDLNLIGITSKKVSRGILNKLEVPCESL